MLAEAIQGANSSISVERRSATRGAANDIKFLKAHQILECAWVTSMVPHARSAHPRGANFSPPSPVHQETAAFERAEASKPLGNSCF